MKKRNWICMICILVVAVGMLTGCQLQPAQPSPDKTDGSDTTTGEAGTPVQQSDEKKPVTLRFSWWGGDTRHQATIAAIEKYQSLNPHVTIEYEYMGFDSYYTKLLTQLSGGNAPEISSVDYKWIGDLAAQGKPFVNIRDIQDKINLSNFDSDFITNFCSAGDYLIGVPCGINGRGALYNTEFFSKYGLTASDDWDWNDLLEAGKKVNQQDKDAHLLFLTNDVLVYVTRDLIKQKYGQNMISDDFTYIGTKEDLVAAMQMVKDLIDTGTMPPFEESVPYETVFADQIPYWLNGQWGMTVLSASNLPSIIAVSPFEIGTMRWVVSDGAKNSGITIAPTMMLAIPTSTKYQDEAAAFINWFINDKEAININGDTRGIPANKEARKILEEQGKISKQVSSMLEQALAAGGTPENGNTLNSEIAAVISDYAHKVGYGELTPEEAGSKMYDDILYTLEQLKKK
jgi:oligogalacturonide transport system substrate-binding protein